MYYATGDVMKVLLSIYFSCSNCCNSGVSEDYLGCISKIQLLTKIENNCFTNM